ncbi:MAG: hypothetical protein HRT45_18730 [Bdellovibrionales bacterium]|nr:hypothetical protein [Bdellovibrionales bacterium]
MKTLKALTLFIFFLNFSNSSFASEALSNFKHMAEDEIHFSTNSAPSVLKLQRLYQSRSLFNGLFGQGWCSDLDRELKIRHFGAIHFYDCRWDQPLKFKLRHQTEKETVYESLNDPNLSLTKDKSIYRLHDQRRSTIYSFNSNGKLESFSNNFGTLVFSRNSKNQIIRIKWQNLEIEVATDRLGRIRNLRNQHVDVRYVYHEGSLKAVKSNGKATFVYQYDQYQNLTRIQTSNRSRRIHYNSELDAITRIDDQDGCWQTRKFEGSMTRVQMSCGLQITTLHFSKDGLLTLMAREGLGSAKFKYSKTGKLISLRYTTPNDTERRYSAQLIPAAVRGSTELDTLIALATTMTQAI